VAPLPVPCNVRQPAGRLEFCRRPRPQTSCEQFHAATPTGPRCRMVTVRLTTYTPAASDHGDCQAGDGGLAGWSGGRQRCGRSSSRRSCGWEPILPSTSVR
jgi:hypothetical protein